MRNYKPIKDLTERMKPARGQVISRDEIQSGPFSLIPYSTSAFALGYGSKIIFGEYTRGTSIEYDLTSRIINIVPGDIVICKINFNQGLPSDLNILTLSKNDTYQELEYGNGWPSPKNVKSMSFLIAVTYNYNENLKNIYGRSIIDGPPIILNDGEIRGSYSALRTVFASIKILQTCYGFIAVSTPTL